MLSHQQRMSMIEQIRSLPDRLEALVKDLNATQLTTPFLAGEWTVAQIVHHLADSHMQSVFRIKLILTEDYPTLKPYDQNLFAEMADAKMPSIAESLMVIRGLHHRWVSLLESLTGSDWERKGYHPENGDMMIDDFLKYYSNHGEVHLEQITRTLAAQK